MKNLGRLGSVAFSTITISLVFHLIAMSYDHWLDNICLNCSVDDILTTWYTSLRERCYVVSLGAIFIPQDSPIFNLFSNSFITELCIPNQILMAKNHEHAYDCLLTAVNSSHIICPIGFYDHNICKCDYTSRTKSALAMTILAALSLGIMVFVSHAISYVKLDRILRWLFPLAFGLLSFAILCIIVTLAIFSTTKYEDVDELVYSSSLLSAAFDNATLVDYWKQYLVNIRGTQYDVKIGWCFGMEILSLQFALASLILYILMFMAKNRPEPENN